MVKEIPPPHAWRKIREQAYSLHRVGYVLLIQRVGEGWGYAVTSKDGPREWEGVGAGYATKSAAWRACKAQVDRSTPL